MWGLRERGLPAHRRACPVSVTQANAGEPSGPGSQTTASRTVYSASFRGMPNFSKSFYCEAPRALWARKARRAWV